MKVVKALIAASIVFWALQFLLFAILVVGWFFRFILEWLVGLGTPQPETFFESWLRAVMNILTYPARLLAGEQFNDGMFATVLLFGISSVVWGAGLGTVVYAVWLIRARTNTATGRGGFVR